MGLVGTADHLTLCRFLISASFRCSASFCMDTGSGTAVCTPHTTLSSGSGSTNSFLPGCLMSEGPGSGPRVLEGGGDSHRREDLCGIGVAADNSPVPHDVHGQAIVHERGVAELFAVRDRAGLLRERIPAILRALGHPRRDPAYAPAASRERATAPTQELLPCLAELSSRARCHERETSARQSDCSR